MHGITRLSGRVRIETIPLPLDRNERMASPGFRAGCGLKPFLALRIVGHLREASPGFRAGCGLKLSRL